MNAQLCHMLVRDSDLSGLRSRLLLHGQVLLGVVEVPADSSPFGWKDAQINGIIAQLAWEYDIPLWNFWAAVQPLPNHGLAKDGFHLTHGDNFFFDVPQRQRTGYTLRNLTALQVIDVVWRELIYR